MVPMPPTHSCVSGQQTRLIHLHERVEEAPKVLMRKLIGVASNKKRKESLEFDGPLRLVNAILDETQVPSTAPVLEPEEPVTNETLDKIEDAIFYGSHLDIVPGSFVEYRRNRRIYNGIVLARTTENGVHYLMTITSYGTIYKPAIQDITFLIPGFLEQKVIDRCGGHAQPTTSSEIRARAEAVGKMNQFLKRVEQKEQDLRMPLEGIYWRLAPKTPDAWGRVTMGGIINLIQPGKIHDMPTRMAIHRHLMHHSHQYLADGSQYLKSHMFYVRPQTHLERILRIRDLIHTLDPSLTRFTAKARAIMQHSRQVASESRDEPPSSSLLDQFEYDAHDRFILKFLLDASHDTRSIQSNPYTASAAAIIKLIDPSAQIIDYSTMHRILVELGAFAPWQDFASLRVELGVYKEAEEESEMVKKQTAMVERYFSSDRSNVESNTPLSRGDFYPRDPSESIRHDFGNLPVYVIDDYGAQELDDGLSIEPVPSEPGNAWIHVHIADPTSILPPSHIFASKARRQGETLYFYHRSYSMLPRALNEKGLSLGKSTDGEPHRVLTFSAKVDAAGDMVDYKVRSGLIRNVHVTTYIDTNVALSNPPEFVSYPFGRPSSLPRVSAHSVSPSDLSDLLFMNETLERVRLRRVEKSQSFTYNLPSPNLTVTPSPLPLSPVRFNKPTVFRGSPEIKYGVSSGFDHDRGSRGLVAEAARLACRVAAQFAVDKRLPMIYRSVPPPPMSEKDLETALAARNSAGCIDFEIISRLNIPSPYGINTTKPLAHWPHGIPEGQGYVRATSPLRRYTDLAVHWQINHALLNPSERPLFSNEHMAQLVFEADLREKLIKRINRAHTQFWALLRVKQEMERPSGGEVSLDDLEGIVMAGSLRYDMQRRKGIQMVMLPQVGLQAWLMTDEILQVGEKVRVAVEATDFAAVPRLLVAPRS